MSYDTWKTTDPDPNRDDPRPMDEAEAERFNAGVRARVAASLRAQRGVPAGTTWGDFVAAMAALGVAQGDTISSLEYGISQVGSGRLVLDRDDSGAVEIREVAR